MGSDGSVRQSDDLSEEDFVAAGEVFVDGSDAPVFLEESEELDEDDGADAPLAGGSLDVLSDFAAPEERA